MNASSTTALHDSLHSPLLAVAILAGCGGGAATTDESGHDGADGRSDYTGPAARERRRAGVPHQLLGEHHGNNRCGNCHNAGGQTPSSRATTT